MAKKQGEVKLLGIRGSPFVCRVVIALKLKGVEYEFIEENLGNKSDLLLEYNPIYKKVPVLFNYDKPVSESLAIVKYIDDCSKGDPMLPTKPYQRGLAHFWSNFIDEKIVPAVRKAVFTLDEVEREKGIEESLEALQFLENELKSKFFGGDEIGFLDIAATIIAYWVPIFQEVTGLQIFTSDKFPKLYNWSQELINHPIVKESLPPREPLLAFFKGVIEGLSASK
ncbi:hypothetical protein TanjilG_14460 [Lupinus angustifolius]|uniref:glutathione transferase n=1 Tax=Lupinus angustifolius TaxID=3871 RepID=A0A1J7HM49_LUPAN|nr:PREDICTED: probable glutathione S-transferase [Lupinus angustifolius]OIW07514.1 hypothetical protein TanjilG_14460 [Lupinus angustifolius]